ncbi:hypothetical protein [Rodentibacter caecimuris]|uniref:hypothetical protein n=1 Tax=Rodentibacter caecimuris TaxID=1796644 RepID=UPI00224986EA|nr:hypothetical protein [Rodentibacter heylii]MCX2961154.1 hypothetical protein [Rodentibacter heylii]
MKYVIELLDTNNNPLIYCNYELYINGTLIQGLPPKTDKTGRIWFDSSLIEQSNRNSKSIKVTFWNETYLKTLNLETEEIQWMEGMKGIRIKAPNYYIVKPREILNTNNEPQTYKRSYYIVKRGDTLENIEQQTSTDRDTLMYLNDFFEEESLLREGERIFFYRSKKNIQKKLFEPIVNKDQKQRDNSSILKENSKKSNNMPVADKNKDKVLQERSKYSGKPIDRVVSSNQENGYYYNKNTGEFEGAVKNGIGDKNRVFSCSGKRNEEYENSQLLPITHSEFRVSANIVRHETKTSGLECICIAFTARNRAKREKKSIYKLLISGYSSVSKDKKIEMRMVVKEKESLDSRKGLILALLNEEDPTNGAEFWDGTDFLAWGLKNPSGRSHAKFRQYTKITISKPLFDKYVMEQKSVYKSGKVKYSGNYFVIPATVFTDPTNWKNGSFVYITGVNKPPSEGQLEASVVAGHTIFWRVIR